MFNIDQFVRMLELVINHGYIETIIVTTNYGQFVFSDEIPGRDFGQVTTKITDGDFSVNFSSHGIEYVINLNALRFEDALVSRDKIHLSTTKGDLLTLIFA